MSTKTRNASRSAASLDAAIDNQNSGIVPSRVCLYGGIGSLGSSIADALADRHPEARSRLIAIDTAKPTGTDQGHDESPDWQLLLTNPDVKKLAQSRRLALLNDGLIPTLEYPECASNGAAEVRLFGTIKFAEAVPRIRGRLRHLLGEALRDSGGRPLQALIFSSICGGTGSALIAPLALLIRDEARMVSPGATIDIYLLAVLPSYFISNPEVKQTDRERLRLEANAAATLREIKFAQTWNNSLPLQQALGINTKCPITTPPLSAVYFYGSGATGATLTPAGLTDRIVAAALTLTHPTLAEADKNLLSNSGGQYWGTFGRPEHAVVAAAADRVAWLPPAFRDLYVQTRLADALASAVRKGEAEQVNGLTQKFRARLGFHTIEGGIRQAIDVPGSAGKLTVDPQIAKLTDDQALGHLIDVHQHFMTETQPKLIAIARAKAQEIARELVPEATRQVGDEILAGLPSIDLAGEVCEALARELTEAGNTLAAKRGRLKQENHDGRFKDVLDRLGKKKFVNLNASTARVQAGQVFEALTRAERDNLILKVTEQMYRLGARHFQSLAAEMAGKVSRLREHLAGTGFSVEEARRAATSSTDTLRSIVLPDEASPFLQRIGQGIETALGESPTPLTPARLMQPGLDELLDDHAAACGTRYDSFLRNQLKSLSGAAAFGRLRFSLSDWAQNALGKLTLPVLLDFLSVGGEGNAPSHLYIGAGGDDFTRLQEMKASRPKLRGLSLIDSGDPFFVVIRNRCAGLPFAALPVATYVAAAEHFEEADQKKAVNVLTSSGWFDAARYEPLSDDEPVTRGEEPHRDVHRLDVHANGGPATGRLVQ